MKRPFLLAMVVATGAAMAACGGTTTTPQGSPMATPPSAPTTIAGRTTFVPELVCPPGSTPDQPGRVDQERPPAVYLDWIAFDRGSGRVFLSVPEGWVWAFDICVNTWYRMGLAPAAMSSVVYDIDSDLLVGLAGDVWVWAYDLDEDAWTLKGRASISGWPSIAPVYDPVSGLLFVFVSDDERSQMWTYDVDTDTWREVEQKGAVPFTRAQWQRLTYDASADRIVLYAGGDCVGVEGRCDRTFEFDPRSHTWSEARTDTPDLSLGSWALHGTLITYDEANERTVMLSDGTAAAYDATADDWEIVFGASGGQGGFGPFDRMNAPIVYDPVNRRIVVVGGDHRVRDVETRALRWESLDDVWAFDLASGEWIQLLAPTEKTP